MSVRRTSADQHVNRAEQTCVQIWRDLYRAALFGIDKKKLPAQITRAEKAIALRSRELSAISVNDLEEMEAIDDALYSLQASRRCLELKTTNNSETCLDSEGHRSESTY